MKGMGHFPMIEELFGFRPYLLDALDHIAPQPKVSVAIGSEVAQLVERVPPVRV